MPILREHDVRKAPRERVDERNDCVAAGDGERTAGEEVILDVDDEQHVAFGDVESHAAFSTSRHSCGRDFGNAFKSGAMISIGKGKTIVEFLSAAITVSVS